jgi:hypothetical protein
LLHKLAFSQKVQQQVDDYLVRLLPSPPWGRYFLLEWKRSTLQITLRSTSVEARIAAMIFQREIARRFKVLRIGFEAGWMKPVGDRMRGHTSCIEWLKAYEPGWDYGLALLDERKRATEDEVMRWFEPRH